MTKVDQFIETIKDKIRDKQPISPSNWVDWGMKLNLCIGDLMDEEAELRQKLAKMKLDYMKSGPKVSAKESDIYAESTDEFKQLRTVAGRIKQVEEFVRLAKKYATVSETEYKGY